jgi:hypothetical protein
MFFDRNRLKGFVVHRRGAEGAEKDTFRYLFVRG